MAQLFGWRMELQLLAISSYVLKNNATHANGSSNLYPLLPVMLLLRVSWSALFFIF